MRFAAALVALAACSSPSKLDPRSQALQKIVDKTIADAHLLGLAVAIVDHDRVVLEKGYGFTDLDRATPITLDTIFAVGSVSKQFTAAAVLRLVDEGKLTLADPAAKYLPELPAEITIQQLLWQTAGLTDYAHGINVGKSPDELVHIIATTPPQFPAGTQWAYSNSNYYVLGRIVEVASKHSFGDYLRDHVLATAGLGATRVCDPGPDAHPTQATNGVVAKGEVLDVRFYGGAGEMCASARDLLRWQNALFGGKVLVPNSLQALTTRGKLTDGTTTEYADGWVVDHVGTHRRIWHNGEVPGFEAIISWYPDDQLQIVLLTNTENGPPANTLGKLEHALAVETLHITTPKADDHPLAVDALAAHVGTFALGTTAAKVTIDGTHLHVHIDGGVDSNLLYQDGDRFVLEKNPSAEYRFVANTIEVWHDGARLVTLTRVR